MSTVFSEFLSALEVRHTSSWSDARCRDMPFQTLFGLSRLLDSYHIPNRGIRLDDKSGIDRIPVPFVAELRTGVAVVLAVSPSGVEYVIRGQRRNRPLSDFLDHWSGVALQAFPDASSAEPDYARHEFMLLVGKAKGWVCLLCVLLLGVFGFVRDGFVRSPSQICLLAVDLAGVYVCWLLMLKSVKVRSKAADRVCGVLQAHGCDHVLEQKAASFFGIIGWAEVGLAYFSVTTLLMFIWPDLTGWLCLLNACCLPFTVWSISYQKFVLHTWCTLCVTVQCLLWLQFFCYLFGGWWHAVFPLRFDIVPVVAAYVAVALGLNKVKEFVISRTDAKL